MLTRYAPDAGHVGHTRLRQLSGASRAIRSPAAAGAGTNDRVMQEMADSCVAPMRHFEIDIAQTTAHIRLLAGAVTFIVGVSMWREDIHPLWGAVILTLGIAVVVGTLWLLTGPRTALTIDADGLTISSKVGSGGHISWLDVRELSFTHLGSDLHLRVKVHQPERHVESHRAFVRPLLWCCIAMYGTPVLVNVALLDCDPEDLFSRAQAAFDATFARV